MQLLRTPAHTLRLFILLLLLGAFCCTEKKEYPTVDYLQINVDSSGRLPVVPYIVDVSHGSKRIVTCGTLHNNDPSDSMHLKLEKIFHDLDPQIVFNEGGALERTYNNRDSAIKDNGEIGLLKFLCDQAKIKMVNGDEPEKTEFQDLQQKFPGEVVLVYLVSERLIWGGDTTHLKDRYNTFVKEYLAPNGLTISNRISFNDYKKLYEKFLNKPFEPTSFEGQDFSPLENKTLFSKVARTSKSSRDQYLLSRIEEALKQYDRIMVVFGGWHVLAIEPALHTLVETH